MQTYYQRTISFEWEIQVFRQLFHHLISAHVESRHQGTFRRVIARMDDGAVCLGSTAADILLFLQHADLCLIRDNSLADADPATPAPIMITSYIYRSLLYILSLLEDFRHIPLGNPAASVLERKEPAK